MEFNILFLSLVIFVVSTILYSAFNKAVKKNKALKTLLEIVMGASLVTSLFYLLV
ncbi:hypothetical protein [Bacillus sp. JCM 19034]|uniref:hypothetical protein n=1 Tax=Bacillus sp. JCM 19034 TaxID=1481928 RepID=UPI000A6FD694|nr:hypothetical protein [Bacillus sp. JCM 19034]